LARILVVDDDLDILNLAVRILGSSGHTVFVAEDALRAIDWLDQVQFDLLLSDANMPHYSGFELVNTVKNNPKFRDMTVAMLTGLRERKDVERAVKMGVDDYIVKPIDPLLLVQKVNALFEKRPPVDHPEILLRGSQMKGSLTSKLQIHSVSELGLKVSTNLHLQAGMVMDIQADFFNTLEAPPPPMKVLSCEVDPNTGQCHAHLLFLGAREDFLQKIRRWLYSHGSSNTGRPAA